MVAVPPDALADIRPEVAGHDVGREPVGDDGELTGELARPNVRGPEKVKRLDEWLEGDRQPAFVWAYGDSTGDRELLARADQGITVGRRAS